MTKKIRNIIFAICLLVGVSTTAHAQMDARTKTFLAMTVYGTVGGALLGTASLAFGTNARAIAQGASLGLYAGILFGGYVVLTHAAKKNNWNFNPGNYYDDDSSSSPYGGDATGGYGQPTQLMVAPTTTIKTVGDDNLRAFQQKKASYTPTFYMNFLNYQF